MPGAGPSMWQPAASHDFRTYFITLAANAYTTMYYDIAYG